MKKLRPGGIAVLAVIGIALLGLIALAQEGKTPEDTQVFSRGELVIETASGPLRLDVEIARTDKQHSQGLMFRTSLDQNSGMIFIGEDGRIKRIVANTTPMSEATISSRGPVSAVLELLAGAAKRLAIKPGDQIGLNGDQNGLAP